MINDNNNENNLIEMESSNNTIENKTIDAHILYYNKEGKISLYLCFIPAIVFLAGYIHSGGSFSEGGRGAVWWVYFPLLIAISPIAISISVYLGIKGLKSNKKILSYISLLINLLQIIFVIILLN